MRARGVLVSGTAYDQLQGKLGLPLEFTGEQQVKNIERPVRAYRVRLDGKPARRPIVRFPRRRVVGLLIVLASILTGLAAWWLWPGSPKPTSRPVVAVLPFAVPAGAEPRLGQLADGLATGIMDELSISRVYTVMGRGASFAYRDRPNPARALGQEQGAAFVVEGTLQQSGQSLRASAQLVDATTGEQLWSERFDRPLGDWDAVKDELGARIGNALNSSAIRPAIRDRATRRPVGELEAYELALLQGINSTTIRKRPTPGGWSLPTWRSSVTPARAPRWCFAPGSTSSRSRRAMGRPPRPWRAGVRP